MRIVGVCCAAVLVLSVLAGVSGAQVSCPGASDTSTVLTSDCLPDASLRAGIEQALDKSTGADITVGELAGLTKLRVDDAGISDATGIEYATGLTWLDLRGNSLTRIDLSKNVNLTLLLLSENELAPYDHDSNALTDDLFPIGGLDQLTSLISIDLNDNQLDTIDLTANTALLSISVRNNNLTSIDVSGLSLLEHLAVSGNELTEITGLDDLTALDNLRANSNDFESIDLSNNTKLELVHLHENELAPHDHDDDDQTDDVFPIEGLDQLTRLKKLRLYDNDLTSIDVSDNTNLNRLLVNHNSLTSIDVSDLSKLDTLGLDGNELTSIDVSDLTRLGALYLSGNSLTTITGLSNLRNLRNLYLDDNSLESIDLTGLNSLRNVNLCGNPLDDEDIHNTPSQVSFTGCVGGV